MGLTSSITIVDLGAEQECCSNFLVMIREIVVGAWRALFRPYRLLEFVVIFVRTTQLLAAPEVWYPRLTELHNVQTQKRFQGRTWAHSAPAEPTTAQDKSSVSGKVVGRSNRNRKIHLVFSGADGLSMEELRARSMRYKKRRS